MMAIFVAWLAATTALTAAYPLYLQSSPSGFPNPWMSRFQPTYDDFRPMSMPCFMPMRSFESFAYMPRNFAIQIARTTPRNTTESATCFCIPNANTLAPNLPACPPTTNFVQQAENPIEQPTIESETQPDPAISAATIPSDKETKPEDIEETKTTQNDIQPVPENIEDIEKPPTSIDVQTVDNQATNTDVDQTESPDQEKKTVQESSESVAETPNAEKSQAGNHKSLDNAQGQSSENMVS